MNKPRILTLSWSWPFGVFLKTLEPSLLRRGASLNVICVNEERSLFADNGQTSQLLQSLYTPSSIETKGRPIGRCLALEQRLLNLPGYIFSGVSVDNQRLSHLQTLAHQLWNGLETLFDTMHPTHLLVLGYGGYPTQILLHIAQQRNVKTLHFECSLFPNTIQMHRRGINASSGLANIPLPLQPSDFATSQFSHYKHGQRASLRPSLPSGWAYPDSRLSDSQRFPFSLKTYDRWYSATRKWVDRGRYYSRRIRLAKERAEIPADYFLIPLQVHDDTQIILNGGFAVTLSDWLIRVAELCPKEIPLVFKVHPADFGRFPLKKIKAAVSRVHRRSLFVSETPVSELIEAARAIITVNSTVGFEAVLDAKPVIACGSNFWIRPELCACPANYTELEMMMAQAWSGALTRPDRLTVERFLSLAFDRIFVPGRIGCLEDTEAEVIADRIVTA
jgi:hypothetical protein